MVLKCLRDQAAETANIIPDKKMQRTLTPSQADEHKKHSCEINSRHSRGIKPEYTRRQRGVSLAQMTAAFIKFCSCFSRANPCPWIGRLLCTLGASLSLPELQHPREWPRRKPRVVIGSTLYPKTVFPKAEFVSFYSLPLADHVENCIEELLECVHFQKKGQYVSSTKAASMTFTTVSKPLLYTIFYMLSL